jgi:hypothetical protein
MNTINTIINKLLSISTISEPITIELLLNIADHLSLLFYKVKLALILQAQDIIIKGDNSSQAKHLIDFDNAIESVVMLAKQLG